MDEDSKEFFKDTFELTIDINNMIPLSGCDLEFKHLREMPNNKGDPNGPERNSQHSINASVADD